MHDGGARIEERLPGEEDQLARAVPHDHLVEVDPVTFGEGPPQGTGVGVRVAVESGEPSLDDRLDLRKRRERALVGRELDRGFEPVARQHLGRGEAGLVRRDRREAW